MSIAASRLVCEKGREWALAFARETVRVQGIYGNASMVAIWQGIADEIEASA